MTKVLVVEDETSYSEALSYVLRKEGFEVAIAETGPDALTEFDRGGHFPAMEAPDLLTGDVRAFLRPLRTKESS